MSKTAVIVIIGNEVLSGKTQDTNSHFLCRELRSLGVEVKRISVIPDDVEIIGREVAALSQTCDVLFTTGGVGPTHDDVTMEGIARGFGVKLVRHPDLERLFEGRYGAQLNESRLRMAEVPEGAELVGRDSLYAPLVKMRNVYIFPGIPKILVNRFEAIKERFRDTPFFLRAVYVKEGEGTIAPLLNELLRSFPDLLLGSYPVIDNPEYKVKVTLESKNLEYLEKALRELLGALPHNAVHRIEVG